MEFSQDNRHFQRFNGILGCNEVNLEESVACVLLCERILDPTIVSVTALTAFYA